MSTYSTEELVSSSKLVKNFWWYLEKISNNQFEKIGILKNNKLEAVIISPETYDLFEDFLEDIEISKNRVRLKREMEESKKSGLSNLVI